METLSWILLLVNVVLIIILLYKSSNKSEEVNEFYEIEITHTDGKKEKFTDVENYELDEYDEYFSIYLKGEDPIYIKDSWIRKIQVK